MTISSTLDLREYSVEFTSFKVLCFAKDMDSNNYNGILWYSLNISYVMILSILHLSYHLFFLE